MHHHDTLPPFWVFFALPAWIAFGSYVESRLGGWTRLAEMYPGGEKPVGGITFRRRSGKTGWLTNYNRSLNVTLSSSGIYVATSWTIRLFHPPLLLPWRGVVSITQKRLLFFRWIDLRFVDTEGRKMRLGLPTDAWPDLREISGRRELALSL